MSRAVEVQAAAQSARRRILIVGSFAPSLVNFRGDLIRRLVDQGVEVTTCAPDAGPAVRESILELGAAFIPVRMTRTGLNPLRDLSTLLALRRIMMELQPDDLLTYTAKPVIYGSLAARLAASSPRCCAMITGLGAAFVGRSMPKRVLRVLLSKLYRLALKQNSVVFFQNPDDMALFRDLELVSRNQRCVLIRGSGVNLDRFARVDLPAEPAFIMLSRITREKGVLEYVRAARALKAANPRVTFRLAGSLASGLSTIPMSELKSEMGGAIEWLGDLEDVRPALAESSVLVLPTTYGEGTPRSVLEAMAMGRAVVATDVAGCREAVSDDVTGFLVPADDAPALSAALSEFVQSPGLIEKMGAAGRQRAEDLYDVHKVNRSILDELLPGSPSGGGPRRPLD